MHWIGKRERAPADTRPALSGYRTVDFLLRRINWKDRWNVAFGVRNLFDADGREPSQFARPSPGIPGDIPVGGRAMFVTVGVKM